MIKHFSGDEDIFLGSREVSKYEFFGYKLHLKIYFPYLQQLKPVYSCSVVNIEKYCIFSSKIACAACIGAKQKWWTRLTFSSHIHFWSHSNSISDRGREIYFNTINLSRFKITTEIITITVHHFFSLLYNCTLLTLITKN